MPTYEYECKKCRHHFEVFQAMSDEPLHKCPKCGKELRRLIFGGAGVIFKGSGFYVTDKAAGMAAGKAAVNTAGKAPDKTAEKDKGSTENTAIKPDLKPAVSSGETGAGKTADTGGQKKEKRSEQSA